MIGVMQALTVQCILSVSRLVKFLRETEKTTKTHTISTVATCPGYTWFIIHSRRDGWQSSVEIQPSVQLMVLFSKGDWGKRDSVSVELADERDIPINMGKLTPYNK